MARIAEILSHVEETEFLKELARRIAREIVAPTVTAKDALRGRGVAAALLDALLEALEGRGVLTKAERDANRFASLVGFLGLPAVRLRQILEQVLADLHDAGTLLLDEDLGRIADRVSAMQDSGVGDAVIAKALDTEGLTAGITATLAAVAGATVTHVERAVLQEARSGFTLLQGGLSVFGRATPPSLEPPEPPDFRWVTMEDDSVCEGVIENSCAPRHGHELTSEEWKFLGEPGAFNLICSYYSKGPFSNCRCFLEPAEGEATSPTPVKIGEAIARGKARAQDIPFPEAA